MKAQVNGIQIEYDVTGAGRTIAFAHSLGMDRTLWSAQVRHYSPRYRVLTFDGRGHGASDKPPGPYSVEQFGEDRSSHQLVGAQHAVNVIGAADIAVRG